MKMLSEAISHCQEVVDTCEDPACAEDHRQLLDWLLELQHFRGIESAVGKAIENAIRIELTDYNPQLTWDELFSLELIGRPVWSEEKRAWFLVADSALDNRSWVDLADACGKITRLGPQDLRQVRLYRKEKK